MKSLLFGLVIIFPFTSNVMADAQYNIQFSNPNKYYNVTIQKPLPYAPNSECMTHWALPETATTLKPGDKPLTIKIQDKNGVLSCENQPKYNTWVINADPIDGYKNKLVAKTVKLKFYHSLSGTTIIDTGWTTNMQTNGAAIVAQASCADGDKVNSNWSPCLNSYAYQTKSVNNIYITFFTTDLDTCNGRAKDSYFINNPIVGLAPTWGGTNRNELILGPVASGQTGMASGNFGFKDDLSTTIGKIVFKLASLAYNTSGTLQIKCDGNDGYKNFMVTY